MESKKDFELPITIFRIVELQKKDQEDKFYLIQFSTKGRSICGRWEVLYEYPEEEEGRCRYSIYCRPALFKTKEEAEQKLSELEQWFNQGLGQDEDIYQVNIL